MKKHEYKRFERVYDQTGWMATHYIFVDRETGVQYLSVAVGQGAGLTPLLGPDGKPLLYQQEPKETEEEAE